MMICPGLGEGGPCPPREHKCNLLLPNPKSTAVVFPAPVTWLTVPTQFWVAHSLCTLERSDHYSDVSPLMRCQHDTPLKRASTVPPSGLFHLVCPFNASFRARLSELYEKKQAVNTLFALLIQYLLFCCFPGPLPELLRKG